MVYLNRKSYALILDNFLTSNSKNKAKKADVDFFSLIDRFISGEIKNTGKDKSSNTLNNYRTTKNHLKAYEEKIKRKLNFENMTLDFSTGMFPS